MLVYSWCCCSEKVCSSTSTSSALVQLMLEKGAILMCSLLLFFKQDHEAPYNHTNLHTWVKRAPFCGVLHTIARILKLSSLPARTKNAVLIVVDVVSIAGQSKLQKHNTSTGLELCPFSESLGHGHLVNPFWNFEILFLVFSACLSLGQLPLPTNSDKQYAIRLSMKQMLRL